MHTACHGLYHLDGFASGEQDTQQWPHNCNIVDWTNTPNTHLHDAQQVLPQREDCDDQFRGIAERRVQQAANCTKEQPGQSKFTPRNDT